MKKTASPHGNIAGGILVVVLALGVSLFGAASTAHAQYRPSPSLFKGFRFIPEFRPPPIRWTPEFRPPVRPLIEPFPRAPEFTPRIGPLPRVPESMPPQGTPPIDIPAPTPVVIPQRTISPDKLAELEQLGQRRQWESIRRLVGEELRGGEQLSPSLKKPLADVAEGGERLARLDKVANALAARDVTVLPIGLASSEPEMAEDVADCFTLKRLGQYLDQSSGHLPDQASLEPDLAVVARVFHDPSRVRAMRWGLAVKAELLGQPELAGKLLPPEESLQRVPAVVRDLQAVPEGSGPSGVPPGQPPGLALIPEPPGGIRPTVKEAALKGLPKLKAAVNKEEERLWQQATRRTHEQIDVSRARLESGLHLALRHASEEEKKKKEEGQRGWALLQGTLLFLGVVVGVPGLVCLVVVARNRRGKPPSSQDLEGKLRGYEASLFGRLPAAPPRRDRAAVAFPPPADSGTPARARAGTPPAPQGPASRWSKPAGYAGAAREHGSARAPVAWCWRSASTSAGAAVRLPSPRSWPVPPRKKENGRVRFPKPAHPLCGTGKDFCWEYFWGYLNTLGVALYRSGQFAEAGPVLERSLDAGKGQTDAFDLFFLAMCHHRLGDAARAKDCLECGRRWFQTRKDKLPAAWVEELSAFQAEADAVLAERAGPP
jgi:hypothetical protein